MCGVAGCSGETPHTASSEIPDFTGPHKELITELWKNTDSDFAHKILADETISDSEWAETVKSFEQCIVDSGMLVNYVKDNGALSVTFNGVPQHKSGALITACREKSAFNPISVLRAALIRNPSNLDENELMTACLIRAKAVDPDYTKEEYIRDSDPTKNGKFVYQMPSGDDSDAFLSSPVYRCDENPVTAYTEK